MPVQILIADDNPLMRKTLRALLESRQGWQVCCEAENGLEAVQGATAEKPDLVILDLAMPVMDGLQAAREIASLYPELPVLMYTNHELGVLARQAQKHGIWKIVTKGGNEDDIVAAIEYLLVPRVNAAGAQPAATIDIEKPPVLGEAAKASGGTE